MTEPALEKDSERPEWVKDDGTLDAVAMTRALRAQLSEELETVPAPERIAWVRKSAAEAFPHLYQEEEP